MKIWEKVVGYRPNDLFLLKYLKSLSSALVISFNTVYLRYQNDININNVINKVKLWRIRNLRIRERP